MENLPGGLWPVMLTPFTENKELDIVGLEKLTEFYITNGANGLFANCLSSEMFQLTEEERITIIKTVVKKATNNLPVIATGTFSRDLPTNVDFIKKVYETGVVAVVINTNQLTLETESEDAFKHKVEEIVDNTTPIPLSIYECPEPHKRLLSPALMKWIAGMGRFFYHKDTSCDKEQIEKKLISIKDTSLGLYNAHTPSG